MGPIPKELLKHTCVLEKYMHSIDGITLCSRQTLENVRLSLRVKKHHGSTDSTEGGGVLYYDCTNSLPHDTEIISDRYESRILFEGHSFAVCGARYVYDDEKLHHIEVQLGGG